MSEYLVKIQGPRPDEYNSNGDCFTKDALKQIINDLNRKINTKAYFGQDSNLMIETIVSISPGKVTGASHSFVEIDDLEN